MLRAGYPELGEHKMLHHELLDKLSSKASMLYLTHSEKDSAGLIVFLMDWFFQHTTSKDKVFARYVQGLPRGVDAGAAAQ